MNLIERAKAMLLAPKPEWAKINTETGSLGTLIPSYTLPIAAVGSIGFVIGYGVIGMYGFTSFKAGLVLAILCIVCSVVSAIAGAFIADAVAPSMGAQKDINKSAQWLVYGLTPLYVALFLGIIPGRDIFWLVTLAGFGYSFYVMLQGAADIKKVAADKAMGYTAVVAGASLVVFIIVERIGERILAKLIWGY
jgi:hypothetical protein